MNEIGGQFDLDIRKKPAPGGDEATGRVPTIILMPVAAEFGAGAEKLLATDALLPPSPEPIEAGQTVVDNRRTNARAMEQGAISAVSAQSRVPLAPLLSELAELQSQRAFCIKSQSRCDRSTEAMIARVLGYRADADDKDRKAVWKQASAVRKAVESGEGQVLCDNLGVTALSACSPIILLSAQSRAAWDAHRQQVERRMRKIARQLPVWSFVEPIKGLAIWGLQSSSPKRGTCPTTRRKSGCGNG